MKQSKKTILYLRTDLGAETLIAGGSISHSIGVINGFLHFDHTVVCATSAVPDLLKKCAVKKCISLKNPTFFYFLGYKINALLSNVFFTFQARKCFTGNAVDYIYQRYSMLNMTGVFLSWWYKVPLVLEFNGSEVWTDIYWSPNRKITLSFLVRWIERAVLHYAHSIIVVSKPLEESLIAQGLAEKKILINPNGVDTDYFNPAILTDTRAFIRNKYGIAEKYVFGFVGTFSLWHGIDVLAHIIPEIVRQRKNAHFILIGDGVCAAGLKKRLQADAFIARAVTFVGSVDHDEARDYLAACDAFLAPTQPNKDGTPFFGSPTKLFEYMSMAKPTIASDLNQLSEVIYPAFTNYDLKEKWHVNDHVGIVVSPGDMSSFVAAALSLIDSHDSTVYKIGNNARSKVIKNYTWKNHVQRIIDFIS